jgi:hypothetical protein
MPLRDHFHPPVSKKSSWEGFHGGWPMKMVEQLVPHLPDNYVAEPRVHLGDYFELDVNTYETDESDSNDPGWRPADTGGTATATYAPTDPTLTLDDADFGGEYAYEVLVFDLERERTLVAAVEIVSPGNKDRPESRATFVSKCATMLSKGVCVSIVDLVTVRQFNLYDELLNRIGRTDPAFGPKNPATYAVTGRVRTVGPKHLFESWAYPLEVGKPLPTLPIWLDETQRVPLDLEASYEAACRSLRIR